MQPLHQATLTQPLQCHLQRLSCKTQWNYVQWRRKLQLQNWISTPKRQKDDFEALFKRNFKRKIISAKIEKICWQITFAAWMQPFQYDLRSSAAKDNSITHAAAAPSNLDAATTMPSAETVAKHNRTTCNGVGNCSSKTGSRRQSDKKTILKHFLKGILKGKLLAPKLGKSADKWLSQPGCSHSNTIYNLQLQKTIVLRMQPRRQATLTQPFQCDLQAQIPKHPITTHTQAHPKQLEATVTLRQKNDKPTAAAPAAQTRYLSSSPAATLHGKTQGFVLRLPPQNRALATSCSHSNAICKHRFQNTL